MWRQQVLLLWFIACCLPAALGGRTMTSLKRLLSSVRPWLRNTSVKSLNVTLNQTWSEHRPLQSSADTESSSPTRLPTCASAQTHPAWSWSASGHRKSLSRWVFYRFLFNRRNVECKHPVSLVLPVMRQKNQKNTSKCVFHWLQVLEGAGETDDGEGHEQRGMYTVY